MPGNQCLDGPHYFLAALIRKCGFSLSLIGQMPDLVRVLGALDWLYCPRLGLN